ncbi:hypothetical protein K1T35_17315 [Pseudonocardia sp. DSM 110487]|uniref:hypothetical protein n=1 Tax=Pseudonocardia sp. DSM 110487 TaxID=2865833 RepID=UPI001C697694|nr:hypothetical protein [Pseudonocardia sp. DSM 110487]QYN38805.1 hypothetical protein K1T35_17315 [Pseudonocardia sp. DSM 110487]
MRITATLWTAALVIQAVTAGLLLSTPGGRDIHNAGALLVYLAGLAQLISAILVWRTGGGNARFLITSAVGFSLAIAQGVIGWMGTAAVHVPLGALILAGGTVMLAQTWASSSSAATQ